MKCLCTLSARKHVPNGSGYRCLTCGARIPSLFADADALAASRVDPKSFYDQMSAEIDARIAEMQARAMKYLLEPRVHVVDTAAGPLTIKADPTVEPGEMRIEQKGRPVYQPSVSGWSRKPPAVPAPAAPPDPLDVEYDGKMLRTLLEWDEVFRRNDSLPVRCWFSPAQRSAVSAHWSAELRARVEASKDRERRRVVVDLEEP